MKDVLATAVMEKSINQALENKSTVSLILSVLLKYGVAPLVLGWALWMNQEKDKRLEKYSDRMIDVVQSQTAATTKNTLMQEQVIKTLEKMDQRHQQ